MSRAARVHLPRFAHTAGVDASDEMLELADARCPTVPLVRGDMRNVCPWGG